MSSKLAQLQCYSGLDLNVNSGGCVRTCETVGGVGGRHSAKIKVLKSLIFLAQAASASLLLVLRLRKKILSVANKNLKSP